MKRLTYISSEAFFDVDFPILKELNKKFELTWIPVIRENGWYTQSEIDNYSEKNNIKCKPIKQKYFYKDPRIILFYIKLIASIRRERADIIYFEYFGVPIFHLLTPKFLNINKIVIAIHDVEQHYKMEYGKVKALYFDFILRKFKHFQVFSEAQLQLFRSKYPNKNVFEAKLYLKDFGTPTVEKIPGQKVNFLFFGIIRANKGLDLMIAAFEVLAKKRSDFSITIAGDCRNWSMYDQMIKRKENYQLIIRKIANEEIPNLFTTANYLMLPYIDVTQSGVLLTSYNYNLPAIASDLEGFREYIENGYNGFLFESQNVGALAKKIEYVLDNHDHLYPSVIQNLSNYLEKNINLEQITGQYVSFFNKI